MLLTRDGGLQPLSGTAAIGNEAGQRRLGVPAAFDQARRAVAVMDVGRCDQLIEQVAGRVGAQCRRGRPAFVVHAESEEMIAHSWSVQSPAYSTPLLSCRRRAVSLQPMWSPRSSRPTVDHKRPKALNSMFDRTLGHSLRTLLLEPSKSDLVPDSDLLSIHSGHEKNLGRIVSHRTSVTGSRLKPRRKYELFSSRRSKLSVSSNF